MSPAADLSHFPLEPRFELPPQGEVNPVPLRWLVGGVLVKVMINGVDAGWFGLGTGQNESFISPKVAEKLKLPEIPEFGPVTRDIQKSNVTPGLWGASNYFRADTVQCGSAVAADVRFFTMKDSSMEVKKGSDPEAALMASLVEGEPIAGVLGWDLLKTLPFLLDTPHLKLTWQRKAEPPAGATRLPMTEIKGCPYTDLVLGDDCKVLALVYAWGSGLSVDVGFLRKHAAKIWKDARRGHGNESFSKMDTDDDELPFDRRRYCEPFTIRWLEIGYGDRKEVHTVCADNNSESFPGDAHFGAEVLRHSLALFDGPDGVLWLKPAGTVPEITLLGKNQPTPSRALMDSAMFTAIMRDDPDAVGALLAAGVEINGTRNGFEPLQLACRRGATKVVAALLEAGAPAEAPEGQAFTPLLSACEYGNAEIISLLIRKGANPSRTVGPVSPLFLAVYSGQSAAVEALGPQVKYPANDTQALILACEALVANNLPLFLKLIAPLPKSIVDSGKWVMILESVLLAGHQEATDWVLKNRRGADLVHKSCNIPPLMAAIIPTRIEKTDAVREKLVLALIVAGADPNESFKGVTPLLLAARHGNAAIIDLLLGAGAKASAKDFKYRNALMRASVAKQSAAVIERLLKAGIDPNDVESNLPMTPLAVCALTGNAPACRLLLKAGATPDGDPRMVLSPLLAALNPGNIYDKGALNDVVKVLLEHGAKVPAYDPADPLKGMALHSAISASHASVIKELVAAHRPPLKHDSKEARDYLARACLTADPATVKAVLDLGVNPAALDSAGLSPLSNAASSGMIRNMKLLLDLGVSPDATDSRDTPPIWMAASYGQANAVRLLLAAGAKPDALHPEKKTTALEVARARGDGTISALLEKTPNR